MAGRSVVVRPSLERREDGPIDLGRQVGATEDHGASRAPERLVRGGGDHIGVRRGVRMRPCHHEACYVGDVRQEVGVHLVGDLAEGLEVEQPGIRGGAGDDDAGPLASRHVAHGVVVDEVGLGVHRVLNGAVEAGGEAHLPAVGEVPAVRQAEPHDRLAGLQQAVVDRHVGRRARVGLDVGVIHVEEGLGPLLHQLFQPVDVALPFVVALSRVALRVLVGEDGAHSLHYRRRGVVLGRDEAQGLELVPLLLPDQGVNLRIGLL